MKKILFILTLVPLLTFGQTWHNFYGGNFGNAGHAIKQTPNEDFIFGGYTVQEENYNSVPFLGKIDNYGELIWTKTYYTDFDEFCDGEITSIDITDDGGIIIAGEGCNNTSYWGIDYPSDYIMKTDYEGNEIFSAFSQEFNDIQNIKQINNSNFIAVSVSPTLKIMKISANGTLLFNKTYEGSFNEGLNGSSLIQQTLDGGFIIVCSIDGSEGSKTSLIKVDDNGNEDWIKELSFPSINTTSSKGAAVQQINEGDYIVCSNTEVEFFSSDIERHIELTKLNYSGTEIWTKTFASNEFAFDMKTTSDEGFIISGFKFISEEMVPFLMKVDSNGNETWTKTFSYGSGTGVSVEETIDGGYIMICIDQQEILIIKTNSEGNLSSREVLDVKGNKTRLKTIDILGRETKDKPYTPLIDLYDDGSSQKRIIIE